MFHKYTVKTNVLYFNFIHCYSEKSYTSSVDDSVYNFSINFAVAVYGFTLYVTYFSFASNVNFIT